MSADSGVQFNSVQSGFVLGECEYDCSCNLGPLTLTLLLHRFNTVRTLVLSVQLGVVQSCPTGIGKLDCACRCLWNSHIHQHCDFSTVHSPNGKQVQKVPKKTNPVQNVYFLFSLSPLLPSKCSYCFSSLEYISRYAKWVYHGTIRGGGDLRQRQPGSGAR